MDTVKGWQRRWGNGFHCAQQVLENAAIWGVFTGGRRSHRRYRGLIPAERRLALQDWLELALRQLAACSIQPVRLSGCQAEWMRVWLTLAQDLTWVRLRHGLRIVSKALLFRPGMKARLRLRCRIGQEKTRWRERSGWGLNAWCTHSAGVFMLCRQKTGGRLCILPGYALNMGTGVPSALGTSVRVTVWPILSLLWSSVRMLVIMIGPSASCT